MRKFVDHSLVEYDSRSLSCDCIVQFFERHIVHFFAKFLSNSRDEWFHSLKREACEKLVFDHVQAYNTSLNQYP